MSRLNFYQEIELTEQYEVSLGLIWSRLYRQIHLALADYKNHHGSQPFGVSFPEYNAEDFPLGKRMRLFANSQQQLQQLNIAQWLATLCDYVVVKNIHSIPSKRVQGYAAFSRKQVKNNPLAIARRQAKRHCGISFDEALRKASLKEFKVIDLPYISMGSISSSQNFKLFIERRSVDEMDALGNDTCPVDFSTYGFSQTIPVPIF